MSGMLQAHLLRGRRGGKRWLAFAFDVGTNRIRTYSPQPLQALAGLGGSPFPPLGDHAELGRRSGTVEAMWEWRRIEPHRSRGGRRPPGRDQHAWPDRVHRPQT